MRANRPDVRIASILRFGLAASALVVVLLSGCFGGAKTSVSDTGIAFATPQTFAVGQAPSGLASADLNADGKPDIVVANTGANTVSVLLNSTAASADATASPAATAASPSPSPSPSASPSPSPTTVVLGLPFDYTAGSGPVSVTCADIDGDGRSDVVTGCSDGTFSVLLNTSASGTDSPTFSGRHAFQVGGRTQAVAVATADLNSDGRVDVLTANAVDNSVSVFLNTTVTSVSPTFAGPYASGTGGGPQQVVVDDINDDGYLDVITGNLDGTVTVLLGSTLVANVVSNPPAPTFVRTVNLAINDGSVVSLVVADFDGDGKRDIAAATGNGDAAMLENTTAATASPSPSPDAAVTLEIANASADISFEQARLFGLNGAPAWFVEGVFAVGGNHDLAAPISTANTVSVLRNRSTSGAISLESGDRWDAGASPVHALALDVDSDGKTDIVVSNQTVNQIGILMNVSTQVETAASSSPTATSTSRP